MVAEFSDNQWLDIVQNRQVPALLITELEKAQDVHPHLLLLDQSNHLVKNLEVIPLLHIDRNAEFPDRQKEEKEKVLVVLMTV